MKFKNIGFKNSWPFLLGLLLGLYFITLNVIGPELTHFPGDLGDGRFNNYLLEHAHKFFTGDLDSFWDAPFMYPEPAVITYSDNLLGSAPFYSMFRISGFDRETSYQLWFVMMAILSYSCCYLFLKSAFKNKYAAVLGAFVFAFSLALQSQMSHVQMFPRFPVPLTIWMCFLFQKELSPRYFFGILFFLVLQFYCGIYLGFMLTIPIVALMTFIVINKRKLLFDKIKSLNWSLLITASIVINACILAILMLPYLERTSTVVAYSYESIFPNIPTLKSFVFSKEGSLFWDFLIIARDYQSWWSHQLFSGGIAVICLMVGTVFLFLRRKISFIKQNLNTVAVMFFISAGITFLFFMRVGEYSFYKLLFQLPGFGSMRAITRIINIELIFFAFAVAFIFKLLFTRYTKLATPVFLIFLALIVLDNYHKEEFIYHTEKKISQVRIAKLVEKMKHIPEGSVVSYEPSKDEQTKPCAIYQIDAMLATQALNLKSINGYSATAPKGYHWFWRNLDEESRDKWMSHHTIKIDSIYVIK